MATRSSSRPHGAPVPAVGQKSPSEFAGQAAIVCSIEPGAKLGNALPNRFATGCRHPDTSPTPGACPLALKSGYRRCLTWKAIGD